MRLPARLTRLAGKQIRDGITYAIGAGGLIYETLSNGAERPTLIVAFVGLLGLPRLLRGDEKNAAAATPPAPTPPTIPAPREPVPPEVRA